uniref:NAD-dependent epimerase/dehydratase domain-containing protein n=1 Tax=viral metagenome TaxID=1070528 RepID=A0A6C0J8P1_9ZZZZ
MSDKKIKVLITGSNGMVGSCLSENIGLQNDNKYEYYYHTGRKDCDLTDHNSVDNLFKNINPDQVIHLAAAVGGLFLNQKTNAKMLTDNLSMNLNVIKACHKYNVKRGIFILSSCIFPQHPLKFPMTEDDVNYSRPHPSNEGYAYGKRMLYTLAKHYNQDYGRNYICLSPVNLYGPYDNFNPESSHVIPGLINRFHKGDFSCYGTGKPLRQFLYAPDFAKIILTILNDNDFPFEHMICSNLEVTIKEMAKCLAYTIGGDKEKESLTFNTKYADGCFKKTVSWERLQNTYPEIFNTLLSLEEGLKVTYEWFKGHI